jgi:hypothetical protein
MVTDTRGYLSRPAAEAGRLALWTGRLAYADPAWKPARGPSPAVRDPASLAPGPAAFTQIAGALHYTTDSLARAATTELDTIRTAAAAGRLYVTTRSLPESYDVPRPYADAPPDRIGAALVAYADAADTCQATLHSAAQVAATVDAPSRVLSTAGHATTYPGTMSRGRLEQSLIDLGVHDGGLLRQGEWIDQMAQQVLAQACRSGLASPQPDARAAPELDAGDPAPEADRASEAPGTEPATRELQARPALEPSREAGEGRYSFAVAEPGASPETREIGNEEPQLEL